MGVGIDRDQAVRYLDSLVNRFFKILPMKEHGDQSLTTYMQSLQIELEGLRAVMPDVSRSVAFVMLIGLLEYMIEHPHCDVKVVRREVFHAISLCGKLKASVAGGDEP